MEWKKSGDTLQYRTANMLLKVSPANGWRGYAYVNGGAIGNSVGPFPTADEAKSAIVAKVREILKKELEALG